MNSDYGHAGGITAENYGTLRDCKVEGSGTKNTTIRSRGTDEIGAVCAVNDAGASIEGCESGKGVILSGESSVIGGIAGRNLGIITRSSKTENVGVMPQVDISAGRLTVGGVAGRNEKGTGQITHLQVSGLVFDEFSNYQYLGGISGENVVFQIKRAANLQIILAPYKIDVVLQPHYPETLLHITRTKILPCKLIAQEYSVSSYENGSSFSSIWQA